MSTVLIRKWDSADAKHIYTDCDDCSYDECWDSATKTHGVYCNSTFYPRCWDATAKNWKVDVPCCGGETVPGTCCGGGSTSMPKYFQVTFSDLTNCGTGAPSFPVGVQCDSCEALNGNTYILEWSSSCTWLYISGNVLVQVRINGSVGTISVGAFNGTDNYSLCFEADSVLIGNPCENLPQTIDNSIVDGGDCNQSWRCISFGGTATVSIP